MLDQKFSDPIPSRKKTGWLDGWNGPCWIPSIRKARVQEVGSWVEPPLFMVIFLQKLNGTLPTDPVQEVAIELLDSQVFSSCWRFLGNIFIVPTPCGNV